MNESTSNTNSTTNVNENILKVIIRSREKKLYDGLANSITSNNERGTFDILPKHANLISLIKDYVVVDSGLKTQQKIELKSGLLSVQANKVAIYIVNA